MKAARVTPTAAYYDMYLRMAIAKGTDTDVAEILKEMQADNIPMLGQISSRLFSMNSDCLMNCCLLLFLHFRSVVGEAIIS